MIWDDLCLTLIIKVSKFIICLPCFQFLEGLLVDDLVLKDINVDVDVVRLSIAESIMSKTSVFHFVKYLTFRGLIGYYTQMIA